MSSTSSVGSVGVVDEGAAAGDPTAKPTTQGKAADAGNEVKGHPNEEQIRAVFSNGVIAQNITSYLNFADMNAARQVSRSFLEMIECSKRFKDSQVLLVTKGKSDLREFNLYFDSNRIWRGIKVDVYHFRQQIVLGDISSRILKNVEFVSLVSEGLRGKTPPPFRPINQILKSTPKITHLQLDIRLLAISLKHVFGHSTVRKNLSCVKYLDIVVFNDNTTTNSDQAYDLDNFDQMGTVFQRLESFNMSKVNFLDHQISKVQTGIMKLLEQNRQTLKKVSLHLNPWISDTNSIFILTFQRLKSFTVTIPASRRHDLASVRDFLANHPTLEELDVAVKEEFGLSLFYGIIESCPNLRKLHLKAKKFVDPGGSQDQVHWIYLRLIKTLKDFRLVHPHSSESSSVEYGSGARIFLSLAGRQLERLSVRGIGAENSGFWRHTLFVNERQVSLELPCLCGFRNLRHLSFNRCLDAVDDNAMQIILKEIPSLEELELSHCSRFTDAGIAGTLEDGTDSIRSITGLKKLSIRYCPLITPSGILSCLKFRFLRSFEYFDETSVSKSFVRQIVSQNPSLESLSVNLDCPETVVLEEVNKNYARFTKLINLCDKEGDQDSDSDADAD